MLGGDQMDYTQIKVNVDERVGVITLNHNPPRNSFTKRMLVEVLDALDEFEKNDIVRCVMLNSEGPNFSMGADFDDIDEEWSGEGEIKETFSELGGKLVARVDFYLPEHNIFIEFQGEQHYGIGNENVSHGRMTFKEQKKRDDSLRKYAFDKRIELIEVPFFFRNHVKDYLDKYFVV